MRKKTLLVFLFCLAMAAGLFGYAVFRFSSFVMKRTEKEQASHYDREAVTTAIQTPIPTSMPTPEPTQEPTPEPTPTPTPYISPISFETLWSQNPDIYAWIELPDTWLAYPILQHPTEDTYYLNRTVDGINGYPGSIFTFITEGKRFDQFNTVIYGHNMIDGSMFGNLKNFRSADYMNAHRQLKIYTPESTLTYTIFAALTYDDRLITMVYDDADPDSRAAFLDSIFSTDGLFMKDGLEINTDSHLITLSTCIGGMPNNRLLVLGVLTAWEPDWLDFMLENEYSA